VAKRRNQIKLSGIFCSVYNTARAQQDTSRFKVLSTGCHSASPTTLIQAQLNQLSLLLETSVWRCGLKSASDHRLAPQSDSNARINCPRSDATKTQYTTETPSWQDIAQLLATAVQQAKNLGDQPATSYALGNLGELYEQTQQWSDAKTSPASFVHSPS